MFNKDTEQVVAILQGHGKKVTSVIYHPDEVVSCTVVHSIWPRLLSELLNVSLEVTAVSNDIALFRLK